MTWDTYVALSITHVDIPSIQDVVEVTLDEKGTPLKREELIDMVSTRTTITKDELSKHINAVLEALEHLGKVRHIKHGYWEAYK